MAKPATKESTIQRRIKRRLEATGWHVEVMSCNAFQKGIPDLYAFRAGPNGRLGYDHGDLHRWIDVKRPKGGTLTKAQVQKWTLWETIGLGVWIVTGEELDLDYALVQRANWRDWWKPRYQKWICRSPADLLREANDECEL